MHLLRLSCAPLNHSQVQFSSKKSGFVGSGLSYRSLVGRNAHCWWTAARSAWGDVHAAGGQLPPRRRLPCRRQRGVVRAVYRMPCGREPAAQFGAAQEATRAGAKPLAAPPTASRRTGRAAPLPMPPAGERVSACRKRKAKVGVSCAPAQGSRPTVGSARPAAHPKAADSRRPAVPVSPWP